MPLLLLQVASYSLDDVITKYISAVFVNNDDLDYDLRAAYINVCQIWSLLLRYNLSTHLIRYEEILGYQIYKIRSYY